jgi:hypothetical protein
MFHAPIVGGEGHGPSPDPPARPLARSGRAIHHHALMAAHAVKVDRTIRNGVRGIGGELFLHRSAVPLGEADLSTLADHGQLDLWFNECEGMCGV